MNDRERRITLRVNELFHDLEARRYASDHPEIFNAETARWQRILRTYVQPTDAPRTIVDVGCGTGFVSQLLAPHLHANDTLIGIDISMSMLAVYVETMRGKTAAHVESMKAVDEHLSLADGSADIVMMNSVLHHLPDTQLALQECERVLKPGGLLMIGHEPNAAFFRSGFLVRQAQIVHHLTPKRIAALLLKMVGLYGSVVKNTATDPTLHGINDALRKEGLIERPLTRAELSAYIDIHSPTAGSLHLQRGFTGEDIMRQLPQCELVKLETYNHLAKATWLSIFTRIYDHILRRMAPGHGATLFLVARKRA